MFHHLTVKSRNAKTGPIPVSTSDKATCPDSCKLKAVCYAGSGPLHCHWKKVSEGKNNATDWDGFLKKVVAIPSGQVWRHNQAGDLRGENERISVKDLQELTKANEGKRGFTYTHYPVMESQYVGNEPDEANEICKANEVAIKRANEACFTVNISADNLNEAEKLFEMGLPVCSVVKGDAPIKGTTPNGTRFIACPATVLPNKTCENCKLCASSKRKVIITFPVHGTSKKRYEG